MKYSKGNKNTKLKKLAKKAVFNGKIKLKTNKLNKRANKQIKSGYKNIKEKKYTKFNEELKIINNQFRNTNKRLINLKKKLLKENIVVKENDEDIISLNCNEIYKSEKYSNSYIKKKSKLFNDYKEYINKIYNERMTAGEKAKIFEVKNHLLNMNNVIEFLINEKRYSNTTYTNRYNLLRRTLIKIVGSSYSLINDKKIIEKKETKKIKILEDEEREKYRKAILRDNDLDLILFHILIFILGLNISEVANIKINNFSKDFSTIVIKRNLKVMKRKLEKPIPDIFKFYIKKNSLGSSDFLVYPSVKSLESLSRTKFLENRFKNFIKSISDNSNNCSDIILELIHKERPKYNLNYYDAIFLKDVEAKFYDEESLSNKNNSNKDHKSNDRNKNYSFNICEEVNKKEIVESNFMVNSNEEDDLFPINNTVFLDKSNNSYSFNFLNESINNNLTQEPLLNNYNDEDLYQNSILFKLNYMRNEVELENNRQIFFKNLKKYNIEFKDEPFSEQESWIFDQTSPEGAYIQILDKNNYNVYNEMKKKSIYGIYPNLKILELNNDSCIQALRDIDENTLLFEVGGEVILNLKLELSFKKYQNKYWCYFKYFDSTLYQNNKSIVLNNYGNISFFLQSSINYGRNVAIKPFKLYNNKIVLLVYSIKKLFKNDILISNDKLTII